MAPTTIAKALEESTIKAQLSVGTTEEKSPYDIASISAGMESVGAQADMKSVREISVDEINNIVCAPCYMMEGKIWMLGTTSKKQSHAFSEML